MEATRAAQVETHIQAYPLRLEQAGRQAFGEIARRWALDADSRQAFLSEHAHGHRRGDLLVRLSHFLGIYRAVSALFGRGEESAVRWLHAPNSATPFRGLSPINAILGASDENLACIRNFLERQLVA